MTRSLVSIPAFVEYEWASKFTAFIPAFVDNAGFHSISSVYHCVGLKAPQEYKTYS